MIGKYVVDENVLDENVLDENVVDYNIVDKNVVDDDLIDYNVGYDSVGDRCVSPGSMFSRIFLNSSIFFSIVFHDEVMSAIAPRLALHKLGCAIGWAQ